MAELKTTKNKYGVSVVVCCASCKFKEFKNEKERICKPVKKVTYPREHCNFWMMADHLENAGKGDGKVRKKAWLDYVRENGRTAEARRDFEKKNGSIFLSRIK